MDKAKGMAEGKLSQDSQPGDGVERTADSDVNSSMASPPAPEAPRAMTC
jgi:hypothetical protein